MHIGKTTPDSHGDVLQILSKVLLEIRFLIRHGYTEQAERLADAMHNLPSNAAEGTLDLTDCSPIRRTTTKPTATNGKVIPPVGLPSTAILPKLRG